MRTRFWVKADAKETLVVYAQSKGEENYTEEKWAEIMQIIINAKAAINQANSESEINQIVKEAKQAIDAIELKKDKDEAKLGTFVDFKISVFCPKKTPNI